MMWYLPLFIVDVASAVLTDSDAGSVDVIKTFEPENITSDSISLHWAPFADFERNISDYFVTSFGDEDDDRLVDVTGTSVKIEHLLPCTDYHFRLYPRNKDGVIIGHSDVLTASTYSLNAGVIRNIEAYMYTASTVLLKWQKPSLYPQCVKNYKLTWSAADISQSNSTEYESSLQHVLIVEPCTKYKVSIATISNNNEESAVNLFTFTTSHVQATAVENLHIREDDDGTSFHVIWRPPRYGQSCILHYTVEIKVEPGSEKHNIFTYGRKALQNLNNNEEVTYIVNGTRPCVEYEVTVTPITTVGQADASTLMYTTRSKVPGKPSEGMITRLSSTNVSMVWMLGDTKYNSCRLLECVVSCYDSENKTLVIHTVPAVITAENLVSVQINNLIPFTVYHCAVKFRNIAGDSDPSSYFKFQTVQDVPSAPINVFVSDISSRGFTLHWQPPLKKNGLILKYSIIAISGGLAYKLPYCCESFFWPNTEEVLLPNDTNRYRFSNFRPYEMVNVTVSGQTVAGFGENSETLSILINPAESEPVRNLKLTATDEGNYTVSWNQPCNTNGILKSFHVNVVGKNKAGSEHHISNTVFIDHQNADAVYSFNLGYLRNEFQYTVDVDVKITDVNKITSSSLTFTVPATVPPVPTEEDTRKYVQLDQTNVKPDQITVSLNRQLFSDECGDVLYYAVLIYRDSFNNRNHNLNRRIDPTVDWPQTRTWSDSSKFDFVQPYQATPIRWMPFDDRSVTVYTIGENTSCSNNDGEFCNGPLKSGILYYIKIRAFTKAGYSDSASLAFQTGNDFNFANYLTIIGILVIVCLFVAGIFQVRNNIDNILAIPRKRKIYRSNDGIINIPKDIVPKKFVQYCEKFLSSSDHVRSEFQLLSSVSSQKISLEITVAQLPENKKKNRYTNILPYDKTRVTIENEASSDYINASFIKGYDEVERKYIATQGPKLDTCKDFWQMIIQYDVDTIVMLCCLYEKERVVCDKYYPDLNEIIGFDDITVECIGSEIFSAFEVRNITVIKNGYQRKSVNHIHFREWPDFGVPSTSHSLISLCKYVRKINRTNPTVVHCSAGVGRTGTYIACDILLDFIENNKPINIFNVVLKLREQRINMVQSEAQYQYLHKCIAYLMAPENSSSSASSLPSD